MDFPDINFPELGNAAYDFADKAIDIDRDGAWSDDLLKDATAVGVPVAGAALGAMCGGGIPGALVGAMAGGLVNSASPLLPFMGKVGDAWTDFRDARGPISPNSTDPDYKGHAAGTPLTTPGAQARDALGAPLADNVAGYIGAGLGTAGGLLASNLAGAVGATVGSSIGGLGGAAVGGLGGAALGGVEGVIGGGLAGAAMGGLAGGALGPLGILGGAALGGLTGAIGGGAVLGGTGAVVGATGGAVAGSAAGALGGATAGYAGAIGGSTVAGAVLSDPALSPFWHYSH